MNTLGGRLTLLVLAVIFLVVSASASVLYVDLNSSNPTPPYSNWSTAATNIQDAVNAANPGDQVLVSDGIYKVGQTSKSGNNRVAVTNAISLQSVNGPRATRIDGGHTVPPVYLASGATISGFTLTNGSSSSGGGIYCQSSSAIVSNCVIAANFTSGSGGGGIYGTYISCLVIGNTATSVGTSGGGISYGYLTNTLLAANTSGSAGGGGAYYPAALVNCTVVNNSSSGSGGGVFTGGSSPYAGLFRNSIIYFNTAATGSNVFSFNLATSSISNSCAPEFSFPGCITNLPGLVDVVHGDYHLQIGSPCIDAGNNDFALGLDLDGDPRIFGSGLDMGAYENDFAGTAHFVNVANKSPVSPYTNLLTAATNIQDAIDVANEGEPVIVASGVYQFGGRMVYGSLTNRVVINKPITVQSVNGPNVTLIVGNRFPGPGAVRCVYMTNNAVLSGFTLTNGATYTTGDFQFRSGGGVWSESTNTLINNCLITFNIANFQGGGAFSGTLTNCCFTGNYGGSYGGGTADSMVFNCIVSNNVSGTIGGGANGGLLNGCTLAVNNSSRGGATSSNILVNCLLKGNWSSLGGGGAFFSSLTNCTLSGNSVTNRDGGGAINSILTGCVLTNNKARYGGGSFSNVLANCLLVGNVATNGGGACYGNLINCTLSGNAAITFGGGSYFANLTNCTLSGNIANDSGGGAAWGIGSGCAIQNNSAGFFGGGVFSNTLFNCTISGNRGGGTCASTLYGCWITSNTNGGSSFDYLNNCVIYANTQGDGANSSTLINCTVRNNGGLVVGYYGTRDCRVTNCIVYNNGRSGDYLPGGFGGMGYCCTTPLPPGPGNFTNAPLFVDLVHLQTNSPCIDTGNNNFATGGVDVDGRPRIVGAAVDIGATEFQGTSGLFIPWLYQYGLPTDGSADYVDSDGDGMNNWQEWIAGTNPTNAASVLRLSLPYNSVSGVTVTWQSVTNVTYYLQSSTNIAAQPVFISIQSNLVGQAGSTSYTDTTATNGGPYFYRVGVQ